MDDRWGNGPPTAEPLDCLVYLSNRVGEESGLVQPGGGNSSIKLRATNTLGFEEEILAVKGSGTDLRTIDAGGFTRLSMDRLRHLRGRGAMGDEEMMEFMAACMLHPHRDPLPSVETPLHSVLPHRVIIHTHDLVTMSLTNIRDEEAAKLVHEIFAGDLTYVPYVRPGFPLAKALLDLEPDLPAGLQGLVLAHHGMVVWAEDAAQCYRRLLSLVRRAEDYLATREPDESVFGTVISPALPPAERAVAAAWIMPVIRKALGGTDKVILHHDHSPWVMDILSRADFPGLARKGVATPEHILRAGRLPVILDLDAAGDPQALVVAAEEQLAEARRDYLAYHHRHAAPDQEPLEDWAKVVLIPGVGMVTAFKDKRSAQVAARCYRAVMATLAGAETLGGFNFLPEEEVFLFEHWPLERRKVEEAVARERKNFLLPRHIVLVLGGASGIGEAAAHRFAEEGAHVAVADLDGERAAQVAAAIHERFPGRATGFTTDCRREEAIADAVQQTVLEYGGLDTLFYTPGLAPRFAPLSRITRDDIQSQLDVHYIGALLAVRHAAAVMTRQGLGGSVICSVSKAALAPGREAAAYGGSKAGLQHALRTAALELGPEGIRVNSINADQVETPLFLEFAGARAAARGITLEQQLAGYRDRNALGVSLIPARAVADLAVLLASELFRFTTGDIITIDGGLPDAFPR